MVLDSSMKPLPRYSMRASATWVDCTVLAVVTLLGLITPEKRMNSLPWLIATIFSPETSRLPFGYTSITVTVIVPLKTLLAAAAPLPLKSDSASASSSRPFSPLKGRRLIGPMPAVMLPLRVALALALFCAVLRSTRLIVIVSPIRRARRSSNRGRACTVW